MSGPVSQDTSSTAAGGLSKALEPAELLGWMPRRVVIVDDDKSVLFAFERAFRDAGVKEVLPFEDGASAARIIGSGAAVDAFVLDWRLPDLGGLALLNRIRAQAIFDRTPVVVVSGFLEKRDFRLAAEFPLLTLVEKPSHANFVFKKLGELYRERDFFDGEGARLAAEINSLEPRANFIGERWENIRTRLRDAPRPAPVYFIAINLLRQRGMEALADVLLQDLLGLEPDCAPALIELGRKKMADGNYPAASRLLMRAAALAPRNLERLCLLGDVQIRLMKGQEARDTFTVAAGIDQEDERVTSGLNIAENMVRHMSSIDMSRMQGNLASMLNAIGVLMVREGKISEGVQHYMSAIRFVDDDSDWIKLGFNLGLAYMRWQRPTDAAQWFGKVWEKSKGSFFKAKRYFDQAVKDAQKLDQSAGSSIDFSAGIPEAEKTKGTSSSNLQGGDSSAFLTDQGSLISHPGIEETESGFPTAEYPPDLLAWDKVRKVLKTARVPDPDLFEDTGTQHLKRSHSAFGGLIGDRSVCILIPKSIPVPRVPDMDELEAKGAGIKVLRRTRRVWALMWPP